MSKSNQGEKTIYLCEGKKELKRRSFGKVVGEAVEILKSKIMSTFFRRVIGIIAAYKLEPLFHGIVILEPFK